METYPFHSLYANKILLSSSYGKNIREILGKQFGESSHLKKPKPTNHWTRPEKGVVSEWLIGKRLSIIY